MMDEKIRAPFNRSIDLSEVERKLYSEDLSCLSTPAAIEQIINKVIHQDFFIASEFLPYGFVDLLIIDPPYNLQKKFNSATFKQMGESEYEDFTNSWMSRITRLLKPEASIYICCDWNSSAVIYNSAKQYFIPRNRITWEREKGRGAKKNWKNCSEDIWFFTKGNDYIFNLEDVKLKRKVLAPYKDVDGNPKDWRKEATGNYRITHPSNLWTDLTVPFWSMPENTSHPTQKPEKLIAKIILASSNPGDIILDPFAGSGTTASVARKLGRNFVLIEQDKDYCCLALKRIEKAGSETGIQGYDGEVFWERNSSNKI